MKKIGFVLVLTALSWMSGEVVADDIDFNGKMVSVDYWSGSGSNEAIVVIDFDTDDSYAFGYKWSGSATGWDALSAIDDAGGLNVSATWYAAYSCHFVEDFSYPGAAKGDGTSWGYYNSEDGDNWTASASGVDSRELSDGDWDGWSWGNTDANWNHLRAPTTPLPEPTTVSILALGSIMLLSRRTSNR